MALLYGHTRRLTARNGGFRPGQNGGESPTLNSEGKEVAAGAALMAPVEAVAARLGKTVAQVCTSTGSLITSDEKCIGWAKILGQLDSSNREFQLKCWADLHNLGQPCEFHVDQCGRLDHQ